MHVCRPWFGPADNAFRVRDRHGFSVSTRALGYTSVGVKGNASNRGDSCDDSTDLCCRIIFKPGVKSTSVAPCTCVASLSA